MSTDVTRTDPTAWIATEIATGIKKRQIRTDYTDGTHTVSAEFSDRRAVFASDDDRRSVWILRVPDDLQRPSGASWIEVPLADDPADLSRVDAAAALLLAAITRYRAACSTAMVEVLADLQHIADTAAG